MSHIVIIINSNPPPGDPEAKHTDTGHCSTSVTYAPADSLSPAQVGNRVAEIIKKMGKIEHED